MEKIERESLQPAVQAYLQRIGYDGPLHRDAATLGALQEHHLHAVPYENLDIVYGVPLSLEIDHLIDKIVYRRRGGYCFELNALFGWLLRELGYEVTDYVARFWRDEANPPPKRRHQVLGVKAEGEMYLCDVGVGGIIPRQPIKMKAGLVHKQGEESYKLERDAEFGWMLHEHVRGKWRKLYSFTEEPQYAKDFIFASFWCEHAPESIFRKAPMVAVRTAEGRNTIAGHEFRIFKGDRVETFVPESEEAFKEALRTYFGIEI